MERPEETESKIKHDDVVVTEEEKEKVVASEEAEGEEADHAAGGGEGGDYWWGAFEQAVTSVSKVTSSAVEVAKSKSSEVYGLMSKDLSEVSTQASSAVGSAASTVKKTLEGDWFYCDANSYNYVVDPDLVLPPDLSEDREEGDFDDKTDELADRAVDQVKKSVSSFWRFASGYAQQMFSEDDLGSEALVVGKGEPMVLDRLQAQLYALAADPDTFLVEAPEREKYPEWNCDLVKRQGEITDLMMNNAGVRKHYTDMVPVQVSHKVFWTRYFFKVHLLELQEAKRQALRQRLDRTGPDTDTDINWDDDVADLADNNIPAELQEKLLSDYERELIMKKMKKQGGVTSSIGEEIAQLQVTEEKATPDGNISRTSPGSSVQEKESVASDDWEKLSAGEKSPKKMNREEEEWVKT